MARRSLSSRNLPKVWKTARGNLLEIKEMETSHIVNSSKFLRRKAANLLVDGVSEKTWKIRMEAYMRFLKSFEKELKRRKEVKSGKLKVDWRIFNLLEIPTIRVKWVATQWRPIIKGGLHEKVVTKSDPDWYF